MKKFFRTAAFLLAFGAMATTFTACDPEEDNGTPNVLNEYVKCDGLTAKANVADGGSITISGNIKANAKVTAFGLYKLNDKDKLKPEVDMMDDQLKSKGEDGKEFTVAIKETTVKISDAVNYTLYCKTRGDKNFSADLAKEYKELPCGGKASSFGSYVSVTKGQVYSMGDLFVKNASGEYELVEGAPIADVEAIVQDGQLVPPSKCTGVLKNFLDKCSKSYVENGVIVTENGTIGTAKFEVVNEKQEDYKVSGAAITSDNFKIDVDGYTFSK